MKIGWCSFEAEGTTGTSLKSVKEHSQGEDAGNIDGSRTAQPLAFLVACTSLDGATLRDDTHSVLAAACKKGMVHSRPFSRTHIDDALQG